MPEGDSIRGHAALLSPVLSGEWVVAAASRWPIVVDRLVGVRVSGLEPVGKNLLVHFGDATSLRIHLGMNGRWRLSAPDARMASSLEHVSVRLHTARGIATCLDAPRVERFRTRERPLHPTLRALGPDVMADGFDPVAAAASAQAASETVGEVLLDQRVACGIGNVWKCELLFLHRVDPFTPAAALPMESWVALFRDAAARMRRSSARGGPRDTTETAGVDHWVYGRRRPCLRCGARIRTASQGRDLPRTTWWCPQCQRAR